MSKIDWENVQKSVFGPAYPYRKIIAISIACLILLGFLLWMFAGIDEWFFERSVRKDQEGIKTEVNALVETEKQIANLEVQREIHKERIQEAANGFAGAINATDQQSAVINAAVNQMQQAANANRGNVNTADFDKLLEDLR